MKEDLWRVTFITTLATSHHRVRLQLLILTLMSMLRSFRSLLLFVVVGGLVLGGCRTYGGYDTESKTYEAMQKAVQSFEDELSRAQADLRKLENAGMEADTLQSLANQFHDLIAEHKSLLETQHKRIERLSADAAYRALHRAYGATVTEQRMMQQKYQRAIKNVQAVVQGTSAQTSVPKTERQYTIRPIGFPKQNEKGPLTMERALRGL